MSFTYRMNKLRNHKYLLVLLGILLFHIYMNYEVLSKSRICRIYDDSRIAESLHCHDFMFLGSNTFGNIISSITTLIGQAHPPLYVTLQALVCEALRLVNKFNENAIVLTTNTIFLVILLFSIYGIGSLLYNRKVGILSAFFVSFLPMIYGYARNFLLDFPLMCMTALSFYLLFKTNKFQSRAYSIALGIVLGLSQLTKEVFIIFIFFPLVYYGYQSYRAHPVRKTVLNCICTVVGALIVVGTVYFRPVNYFAFRHYIGKGFFINRQPFLFYFRSSLLYTGTFIAAVSLVPLISYIFHLKSRDKTISLWFFASLIIFSIGANKLPRFILPVLPAFSLMVASELLNSSWFSRIKKAYVVLFIVVTIAQYFLYFFDLRFADPYFYRQHLNIDFSGMLTYRKDKYYSTTLELLKFFKEEKNKLNREEFDKYHWILFLPNIGEIMCPLEYKFQIEGLHFTVDCPQVADDIDAPRFATRNWDSEVLRMDYVVDKSGYSMTCMGEMQRNIEKKVREIFEKHEANFTKIADIESYDGSHIYIYKNLK